MVLEDIVENLTALSVSVSSMCQQAVNTSPLCDLGKGVHSAIPTAIVGFSEQVCVALTKEHVPIFVHLSPGHSVGVKHCGF